ncbi:MAG TPA: hypothetical protein VKH37_04845, partial [Ferruginibacter sp.]|nr:hypothetical protein [Ferruginibacter sp.]
MSVEKCIKSLLVAVFSIILVVFSNSASAQGDGEPKKPIFDANEVIFGHIMDAHEFHFLSYHDADSTEHHWTIPLPIMVYSKEHGFACFMSSDFEEGKKEVQGYAILTNEIIDELHLNRNKYAAGKIVALTADGRHIDENATVYDFSPTRNVVQMFLGLALLCI